jgi:hypothetical protein
MVGRWEHCWGIACGSGEAKAKHRDGGASLDLAGVRGFERWLHAASRGRPPLWGDRFASRFCPHDVRERRIREGAPERNVGDGSGSPIDANEGGRESGNTDRANAVGIPFAQLKAIEFVMLHWVIVAADFGVCSSAAGRGCKEGCV